MNRLQLLQFVFTTRRFATKSSTEETRGLTYLEKGERKMSFPDKLVTFSRSLVIAIFRMKPFQITVAPIHSKEGIVDARCHTDLEFQVGEFSKQFQFKSLPLSQFFCQLKYKTSKQWNYVNIKPSRSRRCTKYHMRIILHQFFKTLLAERFQTKLIQKKSRMKLCTKLHLLERLGFM